jgi:hypothetical protein
MEVAGKGVIVRRLVDFVHGRLALAVIIVPLVVVLHRDVHVLHRELRRLDEWLRIGELVSLGLTLLLPILLVDHKMLAVVEELTIVELGIVVLVRLLARARIHFANLTVIALVVLRG